jgi:hypothetical protein
MNIEKIRRFHSDLTEFFDDAATVANRAHAGFVPELRTVVARRGLDRKSIALA